MRFSEQSFEGKPASQVKPDSVDNLLNQLAEQLKTCCERSDKLVCRLVDGGPKPVDMLNGQHEPPRSVVGKLQALLSLCTQTQLNLGMAHETLGQDVVR